MQLATLDGTGSFCLPIVLPFPKSSEKHILLKDLPYYLLTIFTLKELKCLVFISDIFVATSPLSLPKVPGSSRSQYF